MLKQSLEGLNAAIRLGLVVLPPEGAVVVCEDAWSSCQGEVVFEGTATDGLYVSQGDGWDSEWFSTRCLVSVLSVPPEASHWTEWPRC